MRNVQPIPQTNFQLVVPTAVLPGPGTDGAANGSLVALAVPGQEDKSPPSIEQTIEKEAKAVKGSASVICKSESIDKILELIFRSRNDGAPIFYQVTKDDADGFRYTELTSLGRHQFRLQRWTQDPKSIELESLTFTRQEPDNPDKEISDKWSVVQSRTRDDGSGLKAVPLSKEALDKFLTGEGESLANCAKLLADSDKYPHRRIMPMAKEFSPDLQTKKFISEIREDGLAKYLTKNNISSFTEAQLAALEWSFRSELPIEIARTGSSLNITNSEAKIRATGMWTYLAVIDQRELKSDYGEGNVAYSSPKLNTDKTTITTPKGEWTISRTLGSITVEHRELDRKFGTTILSLSLTVK